MGTWEYEHENIYETRFETITTWPEIEFKNVFKFLGLFPDPLTPELFTEVLEAHSFERLSEGRERGIEDIGSHYRKGISGDWRNYFLDDHKDYFKELYGQFLIDIGYEEDNYW